MYVCILLILTLFQRWEKKDPLTMAIEASLRETGTTASSDEASEVKDAAEAAGVAGAAVINKEINFIIYVIFFVLR